MTELVSFDVADGGSVLVELDDDEPGIDRVARGDGLVSKASTTLEAALESIRPMLRALIAPLRDLDLPSVDRPTEVQVEFGVRLNAQVGAVLAKTETEGHLQVTMRWTL
ncbi:MAG TPA: CU044_2847 family protein [Gemmataceae bacterium]|nr:CU044_2847 family protein [Gemmataceae bacterium]